MFFVIRSAINKKILIFHLLAMMWVRRYIDTIKNILSFGERSNVLINQNKKIGLTNN